MVLYSSEPEPTFLYDGEVLPTPLRARGTLWSDVHSRRGRKISGRSDTGQEEITKSCAEHASKTLVSFFFCKMSIILFSFVFDKYCSIIN
jgi:hypothetical protein